MSVAETKEAVYIEFHEKVTHYVRGKVRSPHDAEDIVSDVFVKVYEHLDRFDDTRASLSTWIYTVTRNTVIDYYRKKQYYCELDESLAADTDEDGLLKEELLGELADALEALDTRSRDIIILHYFSRLTLRTIAERLEISYSYTKLLHNAALGELRKRMDR